MQHEYTVGVIGGGHMPAIFGYWVAINIAILGLAAVAIVVVLLSKDSVLRKVLNILFVSLLPLVGALYVFGWQLYKKLKREKITQPD